MYLSFFILAVFIIIFIAALVCDYISKSKFHIVTIGEYDKDKFIAKVSKYKELDYYPISECTLNDSGKYEITLRKELK